MASASRRLLPLAMAMGFSLSAGAQPSTWQPVSSTSWADGENWQGGLPGAATTTTTINNSIANVGDGVVANSGASLVVGGAGGGIVISGTGLLESEVASLGASATVTVQGGRWNVSSVTVGGTLNVLSGGNLTVGGGNGTLAVGSSGTLNVGSSNLANATTGGVLSAASIAFGSGLGKVQFNQTDQVTFSGEITGRGTLVHRGSGTTIFTGNVAHTGGTTVQQGTLQIGNGGTTGWISGEIVNSGTLAFNRSDDIVFDRSIQSGSVVQRGTGRLTVTGAFRPNTVNVEAGTLQLGDGGNFQMTFTSVQNASAVIFNHSSDFQVGQISGNGTLTKQGSGTLTLGSGKSGTGTTTISGGTLQVQGFANLSGSIINNATLVLDPTELLDYRGHISGSGTVIKRGAGTVLWSGDVTVDGPVIIEAGTLQVGQGGLNGSVSGDIQNNGILRFHRANTVTYSGTLSGSGSLEKKGIGLLELTGNNLYTGPTRIQAGTLSASGHALGTGLVTIEAGALAVGRVSTTGTLEIGGLELQSPGTIIFELASPSGYDQLAVGGDILLDGGTLRITLLGGYTPEAGAEFDLFDETGMISGAFSVQDLPGLPGGLRWDVSDLYSSGLLKVEAVPEPALCILLFVGLALVGARFLMLRVLPCLPLVAALWMVGNLSAASLAHRYSFDGDTTDSIGGFSGILSEGAAIFQGALYTEAGPGQRPAMLLPAGIFPGLGTSFSVESWYTPMHPGEQYYFTIFGFGTGPNQALTAVRDRGRFPEALPNYQGLSSLSVTAGPDSISHQTLLPGRQTVLDEQTQFLATYDAATRTLSLFIDGELVSRQLLVSSTTFDLPALSLQPDFKAGVGGQSPWNDPSLGGSTEDFRLYSGALTDADVAALYALGADAANGQIMSAIPEPKVILLVLAAGVFGIMRHWMRRTGGGVSHEGGIQISGGGGQRHE